MVRNQPDIDVEIPRSPKIKSSKTPRTIRVSSHEPVPVEMKKKVMDRAKRICEYPKCKENKLLQFHHRNLKNTDNRASNIELLCPNHHKKRHSEKTRKTVSYDILTGEKITRFSTKPKKKISIRKPGKKSVFKQKTF